MKVDILFAIMAVQEVVFFTPIAKRLRDEEGLNVAFLTFHEAGDDILEKEGVPYFSLHKIKNSEGMKKHIFLKPEVVDSTLRDVQERLGINIRKLILHEMLTTNRLDEKYLSSKVITYHAIMDSIFRENDIGCVVQELGGFIAPQLLYHVSRYYRKQHVFIEPAMFPKRIVFTFNDMNADIPEYEKEAAASDEELKNLLEQYSARKTVVIPKKDKHFFQDMSLKRLFSMDNFRRLSRKLYHKYILGREEEYNAILWYIVYHFIKFFKRKVLSFYYSDPVEGEKYIYYPFHVPLDVQLTMRCPEFLNQEALVGYIARVIPLGYKLYVKEHPAAIGGHQLSRMRDILRDKNIRLIHPRYNSFDLIKNAGCVITINSKVGFEAIMQGKPVVVLGSTFYRGKGVTVDVENVSEISAAVTAATGGAGSPANRDYFLNKAFEWSYKGELYENSPENIENFFRSLRTFMLKSGIIKSDKYTAEGAVK